MSDPEVAQAIPALEPVLRRVVRRRVQNPEVAEEVVQETLARIWEARSRLDRSALLPYAVVTARNLLASEARGAERRGRRAHLLVDPSAPTDPEEAVLRREEQRSVAEALAHLSEREREALVAHEVEGRTTADVARERGSTPGAIAVHLATARAKLRVEYLLALRRIEPPTDRCRPVLASLSAGNRRQQRQLDAGGHLRSCATCAELSPSLVERRRGLAVVLPLPLAKAVWKLVREVSREHPVATASATGAVAAAGLAAGVLAAREEPPPRRPPPPSTSTPAVPASVVVAGDPLAPVTPETVLAPLVGRDAVVRSASVESVPADEGFWIGDGPDRRLWVQLTQVGESAPAVRPGARVSFSGRVVATPPGMASAVGVDAAEGSAALERHGAHLEVAATDVRVE